MFDRAFKRLNTFKDFRTELVEGKEKRAGEELVQEITKKQKVEDDKEKDELKQLMETIPDEEEVAIDVISLAVKRATTTHGWCLCGRLCDGEPKRFVIGEGRQRRSRLVEDKDDD
nr:hypothetical protein [Tanacetum cinerariifolium]